MSFDLLYLLLLLPAAAGLFAQRRVRREFGRWNEVPASGGLTGAQIAKRMITIFGLNDVSIERSDGKLSDHFDSDARTLRLSSEVADGRSIAAVAVSAHEAAHARQDADGGALFRARSQVGRRVARLSPFSGLIFVGGFVFGNPLLMIAAGALVVGMTLFALLTLPVEVQASRSAVTALDANAIVTTDELPGVRRVLRAASFTYVASAGQRLGFILFLVVGVAIAQG